MAIAPVVINKVQYRPISTTKTEGTDSVKELKDKYLEKNPNQIMSVATEHNSVTMTKSGKGIGKYKAGGLGNVAYEAAKSFKEDANVDVRTFLPYHAEAIDGEEYGKYKLVRLPKKEYDKFLIDGKYPDKVQPDWIYTVESGYEPRENEFFAMLNHVQSENAKTKQKLGYEYVALEDTGLKGEITALKQGYFEKEKIPYRIFKQKIVTDEQIYFVHTPQVAAMRQAYGKNGPYKAGDMIGDWTDLYTANCMRALADAMPKLAEKENFNPANIWLHDRQMFPLMYDVSRRSADGDKFYNGYKIHCTLHNPGRDYQGYLEIISDFIKIAYDDKDYSKLENKPYFKEFKAIMRKPYDKLTEKEKKTIDSLFRPYFKYLLDDFGYANTTKMTIAAAKFNPKNCTVGTVSKNYEKEMLTLTDIARGLRCSLNEALDRLISVTNGSLPAALNLSERGQFGRGDNGLTTKKDDYSVYNPTCDNNNKIINYFNSLEDQDLPKELKDKIEKDKNKIVNELNRCKSILIYKKMQNNIDCSEYSQEDINRCLENKEKYQDYDNEDVNNLKFLLKTQKFDTYSKEEIGKILEYKKIADKKDLKDIEKEVKKLEDKYRDFNSVCTTSIKEATQRNKEWLLKEISSCVDKDGNPSQEKLASLFLNSEQQKEGQIVHGFLSDYKEGDRIFANWGRPDPQKGFSTFLQGFYEYIKQEPDANASEEEKKNLEDMKLHTKLLFGSGGVFKKDDEEGKIVHKYLKLIQEHDNGKYAKNICFVEGFFPNKLISCCDFGMFTSRFEPCGITPFESYAAGRPVASIRTGGAPNFVYDIEENNIDKATGLLTKDPFMMEDADLAKITRKDGSRLFDMENIKKDILGDNKDIPQNWTKDRLKTYEAKLDEARREYSSKQVADMFTRAMKIDENTYDKLAQNCCQQQIDWAKNDEYNICVMPDGRVIKKSALKIYLEDIFGVDSKKIEGDEKRNLVQERSYDSMNKLTDEFPDELEFELLDRENPVDAKMKQLAKNSNKNVSFSSLRALSGLSLYTNNIANNLSIDNTRTKTLIG